MVGLLQADLPQGDLDELGRRAVAADHPGDFLRVDRVEVLVDLIEQVERRRVVLLDGEDEGHRSKRAFAAGQRLEPEGLLVGRLDLQDESRLERLLRILQGEFRLPSCSSTAISFMTRSASASCSSWTFSSVCIFRRKSSFVSILCVILSRSASRSVFSLYAVSRASWRSFTFLPIWASVF